MMYRAESRTHRLRAAGGTGTAMSGTDGFHRRDDRGQKLLNNPAATSPPSGMLATAIDSKLTGMGKDERALSVSGYVYRGNVKYTDYAFNKVITYKRRTKNHLVDQVESFRMGDKDSRRDDGLLDAFCYGIAIFARQ
jgi:hypothetical protein